MRSYALRFHEKRRRFAPPLPLDRHDPAGQPQATTGTSNGRCNVRLIPRCAHPNVALFIGGQDHGPPLEWIGATAFGAVALLIKDGWSSQTWHICRTIDEFGRFTLTQQLKGNARKVTVCSF
jgi:hypothetical protein